MDPLCIAESVAASGHGYYYLVLNGYHVDRQILSASSQNQEAMRSLGRQLAYNLGINYFDEANVSPHRMRISQIVCDLIDAIIYTKPPEGKFMTKVSSTTSM